MVNKKLLKLKVSNWFKTCWFNIKEFFQFIGTWFKGMWNVFISTKDELRLFKGWGHFWMAQKYADIRTKRSAKNKYAGGKMHYVLPAGEASLVVVNSREVQALKKTGYFSKSLDINKVLRNAYYISGEATKPTPIIKKKSNKTNTKKSK
jgi:hypothetical protein